MIKKRVSIKDIARLAGVSSPTVSRALHGRGRISDLTRTRIIEIANQVGYTPSLVARGLVTQRSYCVGLIVPTFADPFHSQVAQGVEEAARRHHYSIFLASTDVDPVREVEIARTFHGRQVDGIIVSASRVGNRYADWLDETGMPMVLINPHIISDQVHSIYHDDYKGGCHLMQHLLARGYRRIAYIGNERGARPSVERQRAWFESMQAAGLQPEVTVNGPNGRFNGGIMAAEQLLAKADTCWHAPPDAIFCYNDTMAISAMAVLRAHGLQTPADVAVTGFDDIDVAEFLDPPLTTLRQPRQQMGAQALQILLALIEQTPNVCVPQATAMNGELIVRGST